MTPATDCNLDLRPDALHTRRMLAALVAFVHTRVDGDAFDLGPTTSTLLGDAYDAARADAAWRGIPPADRPQRVLALSRIVRRWADDLLRQMYLSPLTEAEIATEALDHARRFEVIAGPMPAEVQP